MKREDTASNVLAETGSYRHVFTLDPLRDPRWPAFLNGQGNASIFHTIEWLASLKTVFGYEPLVATTSERSEDLQNGLPFCFVRSRITGSRLVSLPFSDHCEPLGGADQLGLLVSSLSSRLTEDKIRYIEIRPLTSPATAADSFLVSQRFFFHKLDLGPSLETLFNSFHKDSVQRRIRHAERTGLRCEEGRSESLLKSFYGLHVKTRRRHGLPPFPFHWFCALAENLKERMLVRVAFADAQPVAGIVTLHHGKVLTYKYGASDAKYHSLAGVPLLLWRAIEQAKSLGARELDLGRCDLDAESLRLFKRRWGATESVLSYSRSGQQLGPTQLSSKRVMQRLVSALPEWALPLLGRTIYRHAG